MRVALWCFSSVAVRAGRVLAADPAVDQVGIVSGLEHPPGEYAAVPPSGVVDWDVLATDGHLGVDMPEVPGRVVTSQPRDDAAGPGWVVGANLVTGIGGSLAALELARADRSEDTDIGVAYTVPGAALRVGERLRFPSPVGTLGGRPVADPALPAGIVHAFEAASPGPWAGVLVWRSKQGSPVRVMGVADDRVFLEAIALAAAAVAAVRGAYPNGPAPAYEAPEDFVEAAVGSGLTVASYSSEF